MIGWYLIKSKINNRVSQRNLESISLEKVYLIKKEHQNLSHYERKRVIDNLSL